MSSPARSSISQQLPHIVASGVAGLGDENFSFHIPADNLISPQNLKEDVLLVLKSDVMAALQKEVKSLDEDSWKFAGPRSQIHHISRPCGHPFKRIETAKR